VLAACITEMVQYFHYLVYTMQGFNPQSFKFLQINAIQLAIIFFMITCLAVFIMQKKKAVLFAGLTATCLLLVSFCFDEWNTLQQQRLVVYNISKLNHIELIDGDHYSLLYSETAIPLKTNNYVLKPSHTGYRAWKSKPYTGNKEIVTIGNKTALILNEPIYTTGSFPVDYLIINCKLDNMNFEALQKTFTPRQIVLGSHISRSASDKWLTTSQQQHIPLYSVSKQGAFALKNF
jgi:competence protein ComEC